MQNYPETYLLKSNTVHPSGHYGLPLYHKLMELADLPTEDELTLKPADTQINPEVFRTYQTENQQLLILLSSLFVAGYLPHQDMLIIEVLRNLPPEKLNFDLDHHAEILKIEDSIFAIHPQRIDLTVGLSGLERLYAPIKGEIISDYLKVILMSQAIDRIFVTLSLPPLFQPEVDTLDRQLKHKHVIRGMATAVAARGMLGGENIMNRTQILHHGPHRESSDYSAYLAQKLSEKAAKAAAAASEQELQEGE